MLILLAFITIVSFEVMYLIQSIEYCSVLLNANNNMIASGYIRKTPNGNVYCAYEGIPYAQPPIDKLRFEVSKLFINFCMVNRYISNIGSFWSIWLLLNIYYLLKDFKTIYIQYSIYIKLQANGPIMWFKIQKDYVAYI